jgi:hypothetical protein
MMVRDAEWSTVENRREAVAALLQTTIASMSHPIAAGVVDSAAPTQTTAAQPQNPQASLAGAAAGGQPSAMKLAGSDSKWEAAERTLGEALLDVMQHSGGQASAEHTGVLSAAKLAHKLAQRDSTDVQGICCPVWR